MHHIRQRDCRGNALWLPRFLWFVFPWAGTGACPYIVRPVATIVYQHNDPVNVIRRNHERIAFNTGIMFRQFVPRRLNNAATIVQPHFPVNDLTEQTCAILRYDDHEIRAGPRVIVPAQPDRTAVAFVRVIFHRCR